MTPSRRSAPGVTEGRRNQEAGQQRGPRAAATRQRLLEAAAKLFADKGYHATSVPEIVKAAGVGHGTFYQYFDSRRGILVALAEQANEASAKRPRLVSRDLADRIRADIYWYLFQSVEHRALWKIWLDASRFDAEIAEMVRCTRAQRTEQVRQGIEAIGMRPGLDPAVAAAALTAMLEEFTYRWFIEGEGPGTSAADIVAASETLASIYLGAIVGPDAA